MWLLSSYAQHVQKCWKGPLWMKDHFKCMLPGCFDIFFHILHPPCAIRHHTGLAVNFAICLHFGLTSWSHLWCDILDSLYNVFLSVTWLVFLMYLMKWILTLGNVFLSVAWLGYLSYACFFSYLRPALQFFGCFFSFDGWHMSIFFMIVEKNIYAMGICLIFVLFALVLNSFQWMQSIFSYTCLQMNWVCFLLYLLIFSFCMQK